MFHDILDDGQGPHQVIVVNLEVDRVMNQPQGVAPNALADELVVNENHSKDAHVRSHGLNWAVDRLSLSFLHDHFVGRVDIGQVTNTTQGRLHAAVIVNQSTLAIVPVHEARIHVEECNSACLGFIIGEGDAVLHLGSLDYFVVKLFCKTISMNFFHHMPYR